MKSYEIYYNIGKAVSVKLCIEDTLVKGSYPLQSSDEWLKQFILDTGGYVEEGRETVFLDEEDLEKLVGELAIYLIRLRQSIADICI